MSSLVVAIYSRKSRFTGKGDSLENQIEICREYIRLHFLCNDISFLVYEDEGYSGSNMRRPGMSKLLSYAKNNRIDILICYRLDRVSRSVSDFSGFIELLGSMGIKFISVRENFDTTTPMGRAMLHIASVFAQLERETIAERISDSLRSLARQGYWLGGETPTGYISKKVIYEDVSGKKRSYYILDLCKEESDKIKLIYDCYVKFKSYTGVMKYLAEKRIYTKKGSEYGYYSIRYILTNPVYCTADNDVYEYLVKNDYSIYSERELFDGKHGLIAYNKHNEKKNGEGRMKYYKDWIIAVGEHEGIIDSNTWIQVQKIIGVLACDKRHIAYKSNALLSGVLICKKCGGYMQPKTTGTINADNTNKFYYLCENKRCSRGSTCNQINVSGNSLDNQIFAHINLFVEKENTHISHENIRIFIDRLVEKIEWDGTYATIYFRNQLYS